MRYVTEILGTGVFLNNKCKSHVNLMNNNDTNTQTRTLPSRCSQVIPKLVQCSRTYMMKRMIKSSDTDTETDCHPDPDPDKC